MDMLKILSLLLLFSSVGFAEGNRLRNELNSLNQDASSFSLTGEKSAKNKTKKSPTQKVATKTSSRFMDLDKVFTDSVSSKKAASKKKRKARQRKVPSI